MPLSIYSTLFFLTFRTLFLQLSLPRQMTSVLSFFHETETDKLAKITDINVVYPYLRFNVGNRKRSGAWGCIINENEE